MSDKSNIQKIKSLRERLCSQQQERDKSSREKEFLIEQLRIIHKEMKNSSDIPGWCIERVESILVQASECSSGDKNA